MSARLFLHHHAPAPHWSFRPACVPRVSIFASVVHRVGAAVLAGLLLCALPARADYEAGLRAWETGRTDAALTEWQAAAAAGDARSMRALGERYARGLGVLQDYVTAHMWFNLAAARGDAEAARERDELAAKMTAVQVAEAQTRAAARLSSGGETAPEPAGTAAAAMEGGAAPQDDGPPDTEVIRETQALLAALGYAPGPADGVWGARSASAWRAFLADADLPGAETATPEGLEALRAAEALQADTASGNPLQPLCPEVIEEGAAACWMKIANLPGCHVWNSFPRLRWKTVTWSEECFNALAQGRGMLKWTSPEGSGEGEGVLTDGKRNGHWVLRKADDGVQEGLYVNGKKHGHWILRYKDGTVAEGPYVDDKKHGHWVFRNADYGVQEGPYVDGKRHGHWVLRKADDGVQEGPYVNGKKHGHWILRYKDGIVLEGPYVDGKQHGHWVLRKADDGVQEGPYVNGKKHGHWVLRSKDGTVAEGPYVNGKKHGHWVFRYKDGTVEEGPYVDDKKHGHWIFRFQDDRGVQEGLYVDVKKYGHWVGHRRDGTVIEQREYKNDKLISSSE